MSQPPLRDGAREGQRLGRLVRLLSFAGAGGGLMCIALLLVGFAHVSAERRQERTRMEAASALDRAYQVVSVETRSLLARAAAGERVVREDWRYLEGMGEAVFACRRQGGELGTDEELRELRRTTADLGTALLDLAAVENRRHVSEARLKVLRERVFEELRLFGRELRRLRGEAQLRQTLLHRRLTEDPEKLEEFRPDLQQAHLVSLLFAGLSDDWAAVSLTVRGLVSSRDPDAIADARENDLGTGIARLRSRIRHARRSGALDVETLGPRVEAIAALLFGERWRLSAEGHRVLTSHDGLLPRLRTRLGNLDDERQVSGRVRDQVARMGAAKQKVDLAGLRRGVADGDAAEASWMGAGLALLLFLMAATGAFLRLSWRLSAGVRSQVATLARSRDELGRAYEEVRAASRARDRFLANASHELRTPLNSVIGNTDLMIADPCNRPEHRPRVREIRRSAEELLDLIEGVLDYASLEAGQLEVHKTECDVEGLVHDLARRAARRAASKGLRFSSAILPGLPPALLTDGNKLRRILGELLENAVKFTPEGEVALAVRPRPDALRFEVWDSGPGMDREVVARAREGFYQKDASTKRELGGLGLGIGLIARFAETLAGALEYEPRAGGAAGTRATLTLPLDERLPAVERAGARGRVLVGLTAPLERQLLGDQLEALGTTVEYLDPDAPLPTDPERPVLLSADDPRLPQGAVPSGQFILVSIPGEPRIEGALTLERPWSRARLEEVLSARPVVAEVEERPGEGARVLLVDDNALNLRVAQRLLERLGCTVETAVNGEIAVAACRATSFDCVLMDCQMPVLDGYEATGAIRDDGGQSGERVPIVALTANALPGDRERCLDAGMDDYLAKPVRLDGLRRVLAQWYRGAEPVA